MEWCNCGTCGAFCHETAHQRFSFQTAIAISTFQELASKRFDLITSHYCSLASFHIFRLWMVAAILLVVIVFIWSVFSWVLRYSCRLARFYVILLRPWPTSSMTLRKSQQQTNQQLCNELSSGWCHLQDPLGALICAFGLLSAGGVLIFIEPLHAPRLLQIRGVVTCGDSNVQLLVIACDFRLIDQSSQ